MKFVQDFTFGFRLHQKIAIVFMLVFIGYTVVIGAISIYFLKNSLLTEERKSLDFQADKLSDALERLQGQSYEQLARFTHDNHLDNAILQIATQGPFYDISNQRNKPLNDFRKANVFQHQYNFFMELYSAKQNTGLSLFQLFIVPPHRSFTDITPQLFISIAKNESTINLFDAIGTTQHESFTADTSQLTPMVKEEFIETSNRIKFSGFNRDDVKHILSISGFNPDPEQTDTSLSSIPYRDDSWSGKQLIDDRIVLRCEYVVKTMVFNPASNENEQTPVAILATEKTIDVQWLNELKRVIGSDFGFFQNGKMIFSTVGTSDAGKIRKKNGIISVGNKNYLSAMCPAPILNTPRGAVYPGAIINTGYLSDTINKILLLIGGSIFLLLISSLFISRQLILNLVGKPVNKFLIIVQNILDGDLAQRVKVTSKDEIGFLGYMFNHMTAGIQQAVTEERNAYKKLEIANIYIKNQRTSLNIKVQERTKELHFKNAKLKKTIQQLNLSRIEAEAASKTKSEFIANISHEIRTPMNAIIGFAELMGRKVTDSQQKKYVNSIISGGKSLQQLIDDLLDLSKIEAGKMEINEHPVSLSDMCHEMGKIFSLSVHKKGLKFTYSIDKELPDYILFDEIRLRQILFNLIGNAIKFTQKGSVELEFKKIQTRTDGTLDILLSVKDTGIGIPPDQHTRIFEAFCQQKGQHGMGTGLGLTITKRLAKMMGGVIKIDANGTQGTRFRIRFKAVSPSLCDKPILRNDPKRKEIIPITHKTGGRPPIEQNSVRASDQDIAKLVFILQKELYGMWEQARDFFIMNDIAVFSETIIDLGDHYHVPFLSSWGSELYNQATHFDMETLPATLNMYPELISRLSQPSEELYEFG